MQLPLHIFEDLTEVFDRYTPALVKYKYPETELSEVRIFAKSAMGAGLFSELREESRSKLGMMPHGFIPIETTVRYDRPLLLSLNAAAPQPSPPVRVESFGDSRFAINTVHILPRSYDYLHL